MSDETKRAQCPFPHAAGGGTSNVYAVFDNAYKVNADFQSGKVLKYNSAGTLVGTDTISNFQQYVGGNASGEGGRLSDHERTVHEEELLQRDGGLQALLTGAVGIRKIE